LNKNLNLRPIANIAEICHQLGVEDVIMSPGSRCAPLTLSFLRHGDFNCKTISDERSAAFIALGISLQTKKPTVLICTSGSAAFNYAPAVAEAYFQQIPLLILTADRPPEWIDQLDGQTIRQEGIYGKHVKQSYIYPVDAGDDKNSEWFANRIVAEAINLSNHYPTGPVHINIPFREPFYPMANENFDYNKNVKVIHQTESNYEVSEKDLQPALEVWSNSNRKLVIGGQSTFNQELTQVLSSLSKKHKIPIIGDVISNLHDVSDCVTHADIILGQNRRGLHESLKPDLIVTFGLSTISKNLKLFLRQFNGVKHFHIQPSGKVADTFQTLTNSINTTPQWFFKNVLNHQNKEDFKVQKQENYCHIWQIEERKVERLVKNYFPQKELGEFEVINDVMESCNNIDLHLANSMAVRYANFVGGLAGKNIQVMSNRGTSGIDGSTSTTVGSSFKSEKQQVLITGDMAFFYDRNAFWHNYKLDNLKVLLLNNHAGGIFRIINGPSDQPELEEYFETQQQLNGKKLAEEHNIYYLNCDKRSKLKNYIQEFLNHEGAAILEVESSSELNNKILKSFKTSFSQQNG